MSDLFDRIVKVLAPDETIEAPTKSSSFGARALKTNGRMFALRAPRGVVLKLPVARVEALIRDGRGAHWARVAVAS